MKHNICSAIILLTTLLNLYSCSSTNLVEIGEERNIITNLMTKNDLIEILGEPSKVIFLDGNPSYSKEGCQGNKLEVYQYESKKADQFVLFVLNQNQFVCKKLFKNQKAIWN